MSAPQTALRRRDRKVYRIARSFLLTIHGVTDAMVEKHLVVPESERPATLAEVFAHLAFTAQNYWAMRHIIGCQLGPRGVYELTELLSDFDPAAVVEEYGDDWERLLDHIDETFFPGAPRERAQGKPWRKFCLALVTGAQWLTQFEDANALYRWLERRDKSARSRFKAAGIIAANIHGYGRPVACDFIKELGFPNWSKPDVHLKRVFVALGLAASSDNWTVFEAIDRLARNVDVSPYHADKVLWLICSGRFYHDGIEVGRHGSRFIRYARRRLERWARTNGDVRKP